MTIDSSPLRTLQCRAARSAEQHPRLVGFAFASYRCRHRLSIAALAAYLGCSEVQLQQAAICHRPAVANPSFDAAVRALAAYSGCSCQRLRQVLCETPDT
jgi:hypothetical protein